MTVVREAPVKGSCRHLKLIFVALIGYIAGYISHHPSYSPLATLARGCETVVKESDDASASSTNECNKEVTSLNEMDESLIGPFEPTALREFLPNHKTDNYNYFHRWIELFGRDGPNPPDDMDDMPMLHIWPSYFDAYHNHWQRFRGKEVVFMEVGVQSGGKIPMLRDYFGPGFKYVGIDINKGCEKFDNGDWVHIEIGNSSDPKFWEYIKNKYPKVDLFLDDGGHKMVEQRTAIREMLPHVQPHGVYMCEDLSTSWGEGHGGRPMQDSRNTAFLLNTMYGFVHRTIDWLNAGYVRGSVMSERYDLGDFFGDDETWWKTFHDTVKSIHVYNQIVVYEKGYKQNAFATKTVGSVIPLKDKGVVYKKTPWETVIPRIQSYTKSHW